MFGRCAREILGDDGKHVCKEGTRAATVVDHGCDGYQRFIRHSLCSSVYVFVTRIPMQHSGECGR
jgi:hypothetical protein